MASYGTRNAIDVIPKEHFRFLESCVPYFETATHIFTHANYDPRVPMTGQTIHSLRYRSLRDLVPGPHGSGKTFVPGHTPQAEIRDIGYLICLDTGCASGGLLTATEIGTRKVWHARESIVAGNQSRRID
jgi:serine/threonine protein phosphatase 1